VTRHLSGLAADRISTFFLLAAALFLHFSILFTLFLSFILLPNERVGRPLPKKKKRRRGSRRRPTSQLQTRSTNRHSIPPYCQ